MTLVDRKETRLGDMLRAAREARGWSLFEAAVELGTSKPHLHSLEVGRTNNPSLRLVARFVIVYGLRPGRLISCAIIDEAGQ